MISTYLQIVFTYNTECTICTNAITINKNNNNNNKNNQQK